jgi:hypothetical protein
MEQKLYTVLSGNATVEVLVNTRIYPLVMPQGVEMPAITYYETGNRPVNTLDGKTGLENPTIAINCWATAYDEADAVARAVHSAMDGARTFRSVMINQADVYDPEINLFAKAQTFSCWNHE